MTKPAKNPDASTSHLWAIIQKFLDDEGRPQQWLADRVDTSGTAMSAIKYGERKRMPAPEVLHGISHYTGVRIEDVVTAAAIDAGYLPQPRKISLERGA